MGHSRAFWQLAHFWHCFRHAIKPHPDDGYQLAWFLHGFDNPTGLFAKKNPTATSVLSETQGHHELNYVPTFDYESDGVSYGFVYDLYLDQWSESIPYHGDGEFRAKQCVWERVYEEIDLGECEPFYFEEDISVWAEFEDYCNDNNDEFGAVDTWFLNMTLTGYLNSSKVEKLVLSKELQARFEEWPQVDSYKEKKDIFVTEVIYPHPILKCKKDFHPLLSKLDLTTLLDHRYSTGPADYEELFKSLSDEAKSIIFNGGKPANKSDFWNLVNVFSINESKAGRKWLAVTLIFMFWGWMSKEADQMALEISSQIGKDLLPGHILNTLREHSKTRYDDYIAF